MEEGDFSKGFSYKKNNFNGNLYQQGRVFLDSDFNDQTKTILNWQDVVARDTIGVGVAAIPADNPDGFQVTDAISDGSIVTISINKGRTWADGLLVYSHNENLPLPQPNDNTRTATYIQSPNQNPLIDASSIKNGVKDAVILEVWREAVNSFQIPDDLLEPALGGPDTTEKIYTASALRLLRISQDVDCGNVVNSLPNFSPKGTLTVNLQTAQVTNCDCPVVKAGGFTGFEHGLYRIEIADVKDTTAPMFKWSQFNGGLVGRGYFDPQDNSKIIITGNLQAIKTSGLDSFYLEIVQYDPNFGHWTITYGTKATLSDDDKLQVTAYPAYGTQPANTSTDNGVFFRLWNDIRPINDYLNAKELKDGIILKFDDPTNLFYLPRDYWTFPVRVGEVKTDPLIDHELPNGITYHRVPLAILTWADATGHITAPDNIEDCRKIFRPLTNLNTCCTITVGDGKTSFGDFDSISDAVANLSMSGGEICVLQGMHQTNTVINLKNNIKIKGCGRDTIVSPQDTSNPIFSITDCTNISIENITFSAEAGKAILLQGSDMTKLKNIQIYQNTFYARDYAILAFTGIGIDINDNRIYMVDQPETGVAIYMSATESNIEKNLIYALPDIQKKSYLAVGGIQIASGSNGIKIRQNMINGGKGNGITLGSSNYILELDNAFSSFLKKIVDPKMYDILIQDNEIINMGLSGIGSNLYQRSKDYPAFPVNGLQIYDNLITECLGSYTNVLSRLVQELKIGFGGISIDNCDDVLIFGNRIENNGNNSSGFIPICGICLSYANHANITQNYISNNGIPPLQYSSLPSGIRGGIVVYSTSLPTNCPTNSNDSISEEIPAVRIHDNIVNQPIGQALHVLALGSISVQNNRFNSEYSGPPDQNKFENSSEGSVFILNIGKPPYGNPEFDKMFISTQENLPDGNVLFNNNQIRLGPKNQSLASIVIFSYDDIGFSGNQSTCLNQKIYLNCMLEALATIRATENRFKESGLARASLFTLGLHNITALNQGDNCIIAMPNTANTINANNQVLVNTDCGGIMEAIGKTIGRISS